MGFSLDSFLGTNSLAKTFELTETIAQKGLFDIKDTGVSYRNVNHWDKQDLLVSQRSQEGKWRRFSFVDFVWLKVIEQLRGIGISIPLITQVKREVFIEITAKQFYDLFRKSQHLKDRLPERGERDRLKKVLENGLKEWGKSISLLQLFICHTIINKTPLSLVIFSDGHWFPWDEQQGMVYSNEDLERKTFDTHVQISLTGIVKSFLGDERSVYLLPQLNVLPSKEVKLLEIIHSGDYDSITIHFKNKKMKSLELVKTQDAKRKIVDILSESDYQDIVIKSHQGMVTTIKNTIKMMLD